MIDTLKLAERIERELRVSPADARAAAHIARDVLQEATADLATKIDLKTALAELKSSLIMWFAGILVAHALTTTAMTLGGVYFLLTRLLPPGAGP